MDHFDKAQTRRSFLEIEALEPSSGRTETVLISYDRLQAVKKRGLGEILCAAKTVPEVLQCPTAVFEGLCSDEDEDYRGVGWRCYCGIPKHDYSFEGHELSPRPKRVFLVFVNVERVAYNWRWEKCDETDDNLPINYQNRFKTRCI